MSKSRRLVLRGGRVIDGTGAPATRADVAVSGDRIEAVGQVGVGEGDDVVDASGLVVAPGFHDVHTHCDLAVLAEPLYLDALRQGVTTLHVAQCGLGFAPASAATHQQFRDYLAAIAGDPELPPWGTVGEYLERVDATAAVNVVCVVPHGVVRAECVGMRRGPATAEELARMERLVAEAMEQGARGLSTGLTYFPACEADTDELVALARVVAGYDGVYATHMRDYVERVYEAIDETCEIGRRAAIAVHISHLRLQGPLAGRAAEVLAHIQAARDGGVDISFDNYTYLKGCTLMAAFVLPPQAYEGGVEAALARLRDPAERQRLGAQMPESDWQQAHIASVGSAANKPLEGMTVAEFAAAQGKGVFDACVDLLLEERLRVAVVGWPIQEADLRENLRHPLSMVGSDSIPVGGARHPRAAGTFARYLGRYVRELGLLPLEEAVRRITSAPAARFGLRDRGVVAEGKAADLVAFDPDTILDRATYAEPRRPAEGVHHVMVNGQLALRDGRATDARPGRGLRAVV